LQIPTSRPIRASVSATPYNRCFALPTGLGASEAPWRRSRSTGCQRDGRAVKVMSGSLFDQEDKLVITAEALALTTVVLDLITSISE